MATPKRKTYTEQKEWQLYAIVFPNGRDFFVGMTSQDNLRDTYKNHYILRNRFTKKHFEDAKSKNLKPDMFLLEIFESTRNKAFSRIVAWAKLLIFYGYTCINGDTFVSYTEDMLEQTQAFFTEIEDTDIEELLAAENSLFPKYKTREKKNSKTLITISVTPEEYATIEQRAKEAGMWNISGYCRAMAIHGEIFALVEPVPSEYLRTLRDGINTMKQAIVTIYSLGQYFPNDLKRIQEYVDTVNDYYKYVLKESIKINDLILKHNR